MFQVVIIDDEPIIAEGLKKVVRWADYDCEVAATAGDALSGAETIRRVKPHILFTDIRMPGPDGLAMLAGLRSEFPDMLVTVLTGYGDFAYAQEAIRLGVSRYLLKPSKMAEIHEALAFMTGVLRRRADAVAAGRSAESAEEKKEQGADNYIIRQALGFMEEHYAEKLTLQDVADRCYVSQWHLSKLLNRFEKQGFYDILNDIRIRKAKSLLMNQRLKVSEISELVGYADPAHFAKIFKKLTGVSANEFRRTDGAGERQ